MHRRKFSIALWLTLLAGCSTVGTQYPYPKDGEPSAELEVVGGPVYLLSTNEKGCYTGKTRVDTPVKVKPDTLLALSYEGSCLITFGLVPHKDARYRVTTSEGPLPGNPDDSIWITLSHLDMLRCVVALDDVTAGDEAPQPIKPKKLYPKPTGLACIKF